MRNRFDLNIERDKLLSSLLSEVLPKDYKIITSTVEMMMLNEVIISVPKQSELVTLITSYISHTGDHLVLEYIHEKIKEKVPGTYSSKKFE